MRGAPFRQPFALACAAVSLIDAACSLTVKTSDLEGGCPRNLPGPTLAKVDSPSGAYCVDSTEITNADYQAFFDAQGGAGAMPNIGFPGCAGVTSLRPDDPRWPVDGAQSLPVGRANWCQASAYCQWAGKRLCGKIGGGPLLDSFKLDANVAQWFNACSHGGAKAFPYGAGYEPGRCVDPSPDGGMNKANFVGTKPACEGGFPGLFDMSGNLWEWTDNCDNPTDQSFCRACGGAFDSAPPAEFQCDHCRNWTRTAYATDIGFRCCKDL